MLNLKKNHFVPKLKNYHTFYYIPVDWYFTSVKVEIL